MAFESKKDKPVNSVPFAPLCGVAGCTNRTDVHIHKYNVTRCAMHYQLEIDRYGLSSNPVAAKKLSEIQRDPEVDAWNFRHD